MIAIAGNLDLFAARGLAVVAAILFILRDRAPARFVCTPADFLICHDCLPHFFGLVVLGWMTASYQAVAIVAKPISISYAWRQYPINSISYE